MEAEVTLDNWIYIEEKGGGHNFLLSLRNDLHKNKIPFSRILKSEMM